MKVLQIGSTGNDVRSWQTFLTGQGFYQGLINGTFDEAIKAASIRFQAANGLQPDGVIGNKTIGAAMLRGFTVINDDRADKTSANWPPKSKFKSLASNADKEKVFGKFAFRSNPLPDNPENIVVTDNWANVNIIKVEIPQLVAIKGSATTFFHKRAAAQYKKLWSDWEKAGLMHNVLTWGGSYAPRFVRGNRKVLSNHAFGSAFDINMAFNSLGSMPALIGQKGCVRELVKLANDNGFYWGGHFNRLDGMHFEIAFLK